MRAVYVVHFVFASRQNVQSRGSRVRARGARLLFGLPCLLRLTVDLVQYPRDPLRADRVVPTLARIESSPTVRGSSRVFLSSHKGFVCVSHLPHPTSLVVATCHPF